MSADSPLSESERTDFSEIQDMILTLLSCDADLDNEQPSRLCLDLLDALKGLKIQENTTVESTEAASADFIRTSIADYNNNTTSSKTPTTSVRDVVGNLQSDTLSKLPMLLTDLMSSRVDLDAILPPTQDDVANQEAMMGASAITLTNQCFVAAELYVHLLGMPGAWGAGLIDVGALSGLAALLRRWTVECRGVGYGDVEPNEQDKKQHDDGNYKRKSSSTAASQQPIKRSKKKGTFKTVVAQLSDDEDDEQHDRLESMDDEDDDYEDDFGEEESTALSPRQLVIRGLKVSQALAAVLLQKDFVAWSLESREALVDSAVTSLLAASALTQCKPRSKAARKYLEDSVVQSLGKQAVDMLSNALQKCLVVSLESDGKGVNIARATENHETSVFILRGLLPSLSMQTELPNGQDGRDAAHRIATSTLAGLVDAVAKEYASTDWRATASTTPKGSTRRSSAPGSNGSLSSGDMTPANAARKGRKKRVSFGGLDEGSGEKQAPPMLKGSNTPMRSRARLSAGLTPIQPMGRPRPVLSAVVGLLQKLATFKGVDRASIRTPIVETLQTCVPCLPVLERTCFLRFLLHLCHSKVSLHRLTACEVLGRILSTEWLWKDHMSDKPSANRLGSASKTPSRASFSPIVESSAENMPLALLRALQGRLVDKSSAVRARAATCVTEMIQKFVEVDSKHSFDSVASSSFKTAFETVSEELRDNLRGRSARDEKATVRKTAVVALVEVLSFGDVSDFRIDEVDVALLSQLCSDTSVSTRKAAAEALTTLLQKTYEVTDACRVTSLLERAWTSSVLPLVLDVEPTCVDKAIDLFANVVVGPLVDASREKGDGAEAQRSTKPYLSSWRILSQVTESSHQQGATRGEFGALKAILRKLEETYDQDIFKHLLSETRLVASNLFVDRDSDDLLFVQEERFKTQGVGVWCLLDAITDQEKPLSGLAAWTKQRSFKFDFLVAAWGTMLKVFKATDEPDNSLRLCMRACVRVLSKLAVHLPPSDAELLAANTNSLLASFVLPSDIAGAAVAALVAFTKSVHVDETPDKVKRECSSWISELNKRCESEIASFVSSASSSQSADESKVVRALFLASELCMVGFRADEDSPTRAGILQKDQLSSQDAIAGLFVRPSNNLMSLVQAVLPKHLPSSKSTVGDPVPTPDSVRANAFVTLGKLCLRDENLAKDCLNVLARELHQNMTDKCVSVQSNALLVLGDLCVKYTNLVDRYLPVMAACLQSGSTDMENYALFDGMSESTALVRKHAVLLLSSLLLQDYIKWRGLLFHRFLVASADSDEGVSRLAEMTLTGPLLKKYPKLFFNNFVESLFVLNRCTAHPIYASAASAGDNGAGITVGFDGINLTGATGRAKRLHMYQMMLSHMSDEEKIGITARIAKDVLGAALDSKGDLGKACRGPRGSGSTPNRDSSLNDDKAFEVLSDAFSILTSSSLRVGRKSEADDDDDAVRDPSMDAKAMHVAVAKGKLMSKISRKHLIEIVLPILCKLKTQLQESCSPLLKDLMRFLVEIFRVYKAEVKEFLANDPTLLQEVEYDARQFKKEQRFVTPSPGESILDPTPASIVTLS